MGDIELLDDKIKKIDVEELKKLIFMIGKNIDNIDQKWILQDCLKNAFNGIKIKEIFELLIMSSKSMIEKDPNYSIFAARVLIKQLEIDTCEFFSITSPKL